ncbi:MAG TPA: adenosine kinase [Myxococcota bacterium]|nr:adenosine kinase [Myxococcota bacterium]
MKHDVAGLGNALVDALVRLPDDRLLSELELERGHMHPRPHDEWVEIFERARHHGVEIQSGGSCANTIATLGLMGLGARFCGQVADDAFGALYRGSVEEACGGHALQLSGAGNTGKCLSLISARDAERTMVTDLGCAVELSDLGDFEGIIEACRVLHVTGYLFLGGPMVQAAQRAMRFAKDHRVPVSLDVADPFVIDAVRGRMDAAIDEADIVFLNEEEARAVTGLGPEEAIVELAARASTVIVKMGRRGSLVAQDGQIAKVQVYETTAVDTTGAGDSFAAGYLYGWCKGWEPGRSGDLGSRVAALAVAQMGAVVRDRDALAAAVAAVA